MTLIKPNFVKSISTKVLVLAILISFASALVVPQVASAQEEGGGIFSVIRGIFTTSTDNNEEAMDFPIAEGRTPRKITWVTVTAYSSTVDQCDSTPCITANGFDLCKAYAESELADTIAANFLRFGTQVRLPEISSTKVLVVRDRMNTRYNGQNRIDIWMPTREMAQNFGVKRVKMEIF